MTAQPGGTGQHETSVSREVPAKTPRAIRAALLPEEIGDFDREFRRVMADATEQRDLTVVHEFLERWWWVALSSRDPEAHRHMLDVADRLNRGEHVPGVPWSELKARLGL